MKRFALIGVAGYIAPRHLVAIKETGNTLVAATDPHDSVGVLDQHFPDARFFSEFERFDRHSEKLRRSSEGIDYVTICSPNYLHDAHIRYALRIGANAICEKPLVLRPWNIEAISELEQEYGKKVNVILQLRLHPDLIALRQEIQQAPPTKRFKVTLAYMTPRGPWYQYSWKGDPAKSGGLMMNIGIHLFDLMSWLFGPARSAARMLEESQRAAGRVEFDRADVEWFLSVDRGDLPLAVVESGKKSFRMMEIDERKMEFSDGFTNLHTTSYQEILAGRGFGVEDARPSIELVHQLQSSILRPGAVELIERAKRLA